MRSVFTQKATRFRGPNTIWLLLAFVAIAAVFAGKAIGIKEWHRFGFLPLFPLMVYANTRKRTEEIIFIVNRSDNNHFYFTYKDEDKQRMDDVRIDEYDYWYYTNGGSDGKTNYVLVMMAGDEEGLHFFKENRVGTVPPAGWELRNETVADQKNVLIIPDLASLAAIIDRHSTPHETETQHA